MSLIFYYAPRSSAVTCLWALEELGVPHERVKLDLAAKATRTPEFLALNPNGRVPVLVHDGVPLFESVAILLHLGETFGVEKKLFPRPGIERAQAFQWLVWANVTLGAAARTYIQNTCEQVPAELRNAKLAETGKAEVLELLGILEKHLAGKAWMLGDSLSLVDLHLAGVLGWIGTMGFDTKSLPNVDAWVTKCRARPSFAITIAS
jgi:glutathione S-transferase